MTAENVPGDLETRRRVLVVVGTRPEAIKMFPVIHALRASQAVYPYVITTGQHTDLADDVFTMAGIVPDARLRVERRTGTINELCSQVMSDVGALIARLQQEDEGDAAPDTIATMVHGDTTSALAAGLASAQARVPVIHVEAGLRTYNPRGPFPEEINRQLISKMAVVQIAPTPVNEANLIREMVSDEHVFVSGNTSIDALKWATRQPIEWSVPAVGALVASGAPIIVATLHRRENWPHLRELASALNRITEARPDVRVVLPMHPNPDVRSVIQQELSGNPAVLLVHALGYIEFAHLLQAAVIAISDSGGIQEEAPSVGTPVLVAREETEREEGVEAGTLVLVGVDPDVIVGTALSILGDPERLAAMRAAHNPFGDGHAAERIRDLMDYLVIGGQAPQPFGSGISRRAVLTAAGYSPAPLTPVLTEAEWDDEMAEHVASGGHLTFAAYRGG
jgi:UDP-N-acetylglucosamine 2-epimerase (non-hydrolysing)